MGLQSRDRAFREAVVVVERRVKDDLTVKVKLVGATGACAQIDGLKGLVEESRSRMSPAAIVGSRGG